MSEIDSHLLAYLAGIIDGEGCILITRVRKSGKPSGNYQLRVSCAMIEPAEPIIMLHRLFGGSLAKKRSHVNNTTLNYTRPQTQWCIQSSDAERLLKALLPYLTVKKAQAELGIEFLTVRGNYEKNGRKGVPEEEVSKREDFFIRMKALK